MVDITYNKLLSSRIFHLSEKLSLAFDDDVCVCVLAYYSYIIPIYRSYS